MTLYGEIPRDLVSLRGPEDREILVVVRIGRPENGDEGACPFGQDGAPSLPREAGVGHNNASGEGQLANILLNLSDRESCIRKIFRIPIKGYQIGRL